MFFKEKIEKWNNKNYPEQSAQNPVYVFPEINILKIFKIKMVVQFLVLGELLIMFKFSNPFCLVQRRNGAGNQFITGNGKSGVGEARNAANHNHYKNQETARKEPVNHFVIVFVCHSLYNFVRAVAVDSLPRRH